MGGLFQPFQVRAGSQELHHQLLFWPFMLSPGIVMAQVGMSYSLLMYYNKCNEAQGLLEVKSSPSGA